jgi:hypothetical protein
MADPSRRFSEGLDVALAIYLGAYSLVAACFALALYAHLQPTTSPNPGVAAYDAPPRTIISYSLPARLKGDPQTDGYAAAAVEPEQAVSPPDQPAKQAAKAEEARTEVKAQAKPRRVAARPKEQRSPEWDYAGHFAGYRPQPLASSSRPWF